MRPRIPSAAVILSTAFATLTACGDDVAENDATCDASQPILVANLAAKIGTFIRITPAGDHLYINIYGFEGPPDQPGHVHEPDNTIDGISNGGQTWITGPCGESPVLIGDGEFQALTPVFHGEGADATLACASGGDGDRIYRLDLTGATPPKLLLEHWSCGIDTSRPVATHRDDDNNIHELWYVPNYPSLADAVRLAENIQKQIGNDSERNYYIGDDEALHAVDLAGNDEILQADPSGVDGGATGSALLYARTGPTRLLWVAQPPGEPETAYLYRGETDDIIKLVDSQPTDWSEDSFASAWGFNWSRTYIFHHPYVDGEPTLRVFDLDGAPIAFPTGIQALDWRVAGDGVFGSAEGPQGRRWVYAAFGATDAIPLDLVWDDPDREIVGTGSDELYYYDRAADLTWAVPNDGGPAVVVPDFVYTYGENDGLSLHNEQLLHVDWQTGESTVLHDDAGAYGMNGEFHGDKYVATGIFYTDISSREHPTLWFIPTALLPGTAWR